MSNEWPGNVAAYELAAGLGEDPPFPLDIRGGF
jgi:hypothetical protein